LKNTMSEFIDLHIHTTYSDGLYTPTKAVKMAYAANLAAVAITDHDELAGIPEATREGDDLGIEVIAGIEMSTILEGFDVHLLGYFIDYHDPAIQQYVKQCKEWRWERARKIIELLKKCGIHIPFELVKLKAGNGSIGRPHIADVLVEEGYVFSFHEAFDKYLGENKPAYVPKKKVDPGNAIDLIHKVGGLAFIAHPGVELDDDIIFRVIALGLDGLETIHPNHSQVDIEHLAKIASEHNLLQSGGSDCHGEREGERLIGKIKVPASFLQEMKKVLARTRSTIPSNPPE